MTDTDVAFEALAVRRRRYVLYHLLEVDTEVPLRNIAGLIAAVESGGSVVSVPTERRRRIAVELAHTHLPPLEAQGFVNYDRERDLVGLASDAERVTPYLELASQYERPPTVAGSEV